MRRRPRAAGSGGGGAIVRANGLLSWGINSGGHLGGGYFGSGSYYAYPQGVINLTNIAQIAVGSGDSLAVLNTGKVYVWGANDAGGGAGLGYPNRDIEDPTLITGGVPLYLEEAIKSEKLPWIQRRGPIGPVLPAIKEVSTAGQHAAGLLADGTGRVMAWGGGTRGQLGNGWENVNDRGTDEKGKGEYVQFAPFWVLTGAPAQSETGFNAGGMKLASGVAGTVSAVWTYDQILDPTWGNGTRANVLKDVKLLTCAQETTYYVKTNNEVWLNGRPAARTAAALYAEKDTTWDPTNPAHLPVGFSIREISGTHSGYLLRISNGNPAENEARFVGNSEEYMAGNGKEASENSATREVITPLINATTPAKGVHAVAKAEYSIKLLKSPSGNPITDGTLWTAGSNEELQQGLGQPPSSAVPYVTQITSLNSGGRKVIGISSNGEVRGGGRNGGEMSIARLDDGSVRTWGWGFNLGDGPSVRWIGFGTLGTGLSANSSVPIEPVGKPKNITQVATAGSVMLAVQDPGGPPTQSLSAIQTLAGSVTVKWTLPAGKAEELPLWRAPTGWKVTLFGPSATLKSALLPAGAREYTQLGVTPGEWEIVVSESPLPVASTPAITGEALKAANASEEVTVAWANPPAPEPSFIIEWRRPGTFLKKEVLTQEDWKRAEPDALGSARTFTFKMTPSAHGLTEKEAEVAVKGGYVGSYKTRKRLITVV